MVGTGWALTVGHGVRTAHVARGGRGETGEHGLDRSNMQMRSREKENTTSCVLRADTVSEQL